MKPAGRQSIDDLFDDVIADYEAMADGLEDGRVGTICDMVVDDLERLRDDLSVGIYEPAEPGDPTIVKKPDNPTREDALQAKIGTAVAAEATEMLFGQSVVAFDDKTGDLIIAVDEADIIDWLGRIGEGDRDYDNSRFGPPR